ncbi:MAG: antiterminator LoaP [Oscillospiraceae bacterium]|nr:antiterminator LoaP [Oscillospiraceae bacterium]
MAWYAIHVRTGQEDAVCGEIRRHLCLLGYAEAYRLLVPKRKLLEPHQGEFIEVIRTMFPSYVLVESEDIRGFAKETVPCNGIFRFLEHDGLFEEILLEEIAQIIYMTDEAGVIGASETIAEGVWVEVVSGPLKGFEGQIRKIDKHKRRAKVLFKFDGREHLIDLCVTIRKEGTD